MNEKDPYQEQPPEPGSFGQNPRPEVGPGPETDRPPFGQQAYGQQPYGQQSGFVPGTWGQAPMPKHPQAMTALVLGIVSLAGALMCLLPILCAPFAWYYGRKAVKEIDAKPERYSGRSEAMGGMVTGIIGTVGLFLLVLLAIGLIVVFSAVGFSETGASDPSVVGTPT